MTMHAGLASGRWWTLTRAEQLGNAGADAGRAIRARQEGDQGASTRPSIARWSFST